MKGFWTGAVTFSLLAFSALVAAESQKQFIAIVRGEITVDSEGRVKAVSLQKVKDATFEKYYLDKVKSWTFHPVTLNGRPVEATAEFSFEVLATYSADNALKRIEFANIEFQQSAVEAEFLEKQGIAPGKRCALEYPRNALLSGAGARLVVALDITQDGRVTDAAVLSAAVTNASAQDAQKLLAPFAVKSLKCLKQYEFTQAELSERNCQNGCIASTTTMFIFSPLLGQWQEYLKVPVEPVPWVIASELKDIDQSEQSQIVRLKEDPAGKPVEIGG